MLLLSHHDVAALLDPAEVLRIAEDAVRQAAEGAVRWPEPRLMTLGSAPAFPARFRFKSCALDSAGVVGTRVSAVSPRLPASEDEPTRVMLLNDAATGALVGIVDERWSFAVRTGASVGLALKYLAGPDTSTIGIVGAGQVGRGVVYALPAAVPVKRYLVFDQRREAAERLAEWVRRTLGLEARVADSVEAVFDAASTVVIGTTTKEPMVRTAWIRPGYTVGRLGSETEVDLDAYLTVDKLVIDDWEAVGYRRDFRDLIRERGFDRSQQIHADFVGLVSGERPGRERPEERILFRSEGLAIMDTAVSWHLCQKAAATGVGRRLVG